VVKKEWGCTSIPQIRLYGADRTLPDFLPFYAGEREVENAIYTLRLNQKFELY
jgi:hypothetical protein